MCRSILVASDGTPAAMGALELARKLETDQDVRVEIMGVVEPVPVFDAGFLVAMPEMDLYETRQEALRGELQRQVEGVTGSGDPWPIRVEAGLTGPRIVKRAHDFGADLILMGLGRHRPVDRIFGTETALQVIRLSHIPVLAVPENVRELPRNAALGVDFSHFNRSALAAALRVMNAPWELHLVHVMSGMEFLPTMSEQWRSDYEDELLDRLGELTQGATRPDGSELISHILEGEPSHELLSFAENRNIDLLVVGSHGHSFIGRLLMGSVSTRVVRGAAIPVLVIPPEDPTREAFPEKDGAADPSHPWVKALDDFSKANAGRRTTLEVTDPELGPQICGRDLPLWGVDFDPRRNRIEIMLGRSGTVEGHLTHSLPNPREIEVIQDERGVSVALRVLLPQGEVLLRVHRD